MRSYEFESKTTLELPDLEVGDDLLVGKFKNRKAKITGFTKDQHNQPIAKTTKGDQKILKPRVPKLEESLQIGLAKKAWASLSDTAKAAINAWESTNWTGGALEEHVKANDEVAQEIATAIAPVLASIGSSIKLYRGERKSEWDSSVKFLESWTTDLKVAEHFAGLRTSSWKPLIKPVLSDESIQKAIHQLDTRGYVKVGQHKYVKKPTPDWPEGWPKSKGTYYHIYSGSEFITDGDDLEEALRDKQEWNRDHNEKLLSKAIIREEQIEVGRIIWITNNLDSKEFIIRRN